MIPHIKDNRCFHLADIRKSTLNTENLLGEVKTNYWTVSREEKRKRRKKKINEVHLFHFVSICSTNLNQYGFCLQYGTNLLPKYVRGWASKFSLKKKKTWPTWTWIPVRCKNLYIVPRHAMIFRLNYLFILLYFLLILSPQARW